MSDNLKGVSYLVLAALIVSLQNIVIRWIGGDYTVLQIVAIRSLIALPCVCQLKKYPFDNRKSAHLGCFV